MRARAPQSRLASRQKFYINYKRQPRSDPIRSDLFFAPLWGFSHFQLPAARGNSIHFGGFAKTFVALAHTYKSAEEMSSWAKYCLSFARSRRRRCLGSARPAASGRRLVEIRSHAPRSRPRGERVSFYYCRRRQRRRRLRKGRKVVNVGAVVSQRYD